MIRFYTICSLLTLVLFCSCSSDTTEKSKVGIIAGSVSDRTTGEPIATANIIMSPGGNAAVTGTDGTFSFHNLIENEYMLSVEKEGYRPNECTLYVIAGEVTPVHLLMERIPAIVTADRDVLDFGNDISNNSMSFNIVNDYYEDLNWHVEYNCEWITSIEPASGTCKYGKTATIIVNIDRLKTKMGNNETKLVIVSDNGNGSSEITLTVYNILSSTASVRTKAVTNIGKDYATFNGEIINIGNPTYTEKGFVYSISSNPTLDNTINKITVNNNSNDFSAYVDGIKLGEKYHVRAYAYHPLYVVYGDEVVFEPNDGYYKYGNLYVQITDIGQGGFITMDEACRNSTVGGMSWRIPTLSELSYLYQNRDLIGGFRLGNYWSSEASTQSDYTGTPGHPYTYYYTVWYYSFSNGTSSYITKSSTNGSSPSWPTNSFYTRCVRNVN